MFPYDMDFTFSNASNSSLFPNTDLTKLTQSNASESKDVLESYLRTLPDEFHHHVSHSMGNALQQLRQ
jgi:hypothetical protein